MSTPVIPPRPQQRTQQVAAANSAGQLPDIPPRPIPKRAVSPANHSPLNEPYYLGKRKSVDLIPRPPSVSRFPTSGEEGMEYGEIQYQPPNPVSALGADAAAQTRNVDKDLKLHAPKPSLPNTSAAAQVQAVTRTDSSSAAAHGIGRPPSQDGEALGRSRSRHSISRPESAASGDRRRSVYTDEHEHGPAQVGMRVPINPLLGDVQAPSPAPMSPHNTGHTPDGKRRNHNRTKSGRDVAQPPDSYGLHGHGVAPINKFEREWYAKHPDQLQHEEGAGHGVYESIGSGRGSFALSSDDLNKIVRGTASHGHGFGTTGKVVSYPDEQIGYDASEQYQSRNQTPVQKPSAGSALPAAESPLKKSSGQEDIRGPSDELSPLDDPVHIDAPARKFNKITGGQGTIRERDPAKPYVTHTDEDDDYKVPILAEDELAKEVGGDNLQPAVSPMHHRRSDEYGLGEHSRPSSRPGSIYQMHSASHSLTRFMSHNDSHTPLEDVDEYEPLFPEDDGKRKEATMAERFKRRPDTLQHRFPSQDIWEDTPPSAMYEANVSTPDLPREVKEAAGAGSHPQTGLFETPEQEAARKGEPSEEEKRKLIPAQERLAKSKFAPHLRDDMPTRPGLQPRFPSQDIWEDSPDSQNLVTTVNAEEDEEISPVDVRPSVPSRPAKSRLGEGASSDQIAPSVQPELPARPEKKAVHAVPPADAKLTDTSIPLTKEVSPTEIRKVPSLPDKPKPQIPVRPAKKLDSEVLSKVTSQGSIESNETERSVTSPPVPKAKPQIPARPQGGKIASLRSNFMNDLNQKLGLGPPKEKEPEPEVEPEEAKPLEDARKSRARGPQRRAPAKSPSAPPTQTFSFSMSAPTTLFSINESDSLVVAAAKAEESLTDEKIAQIESATPADAPLPPTTDTTTEAASTETEAPKAAAPSLATNTAGEHVDPGTAPAEPNVVSKVSTKADEVPVSLQTTATDTSGGVITRDLKNKENEPVGGNVLEELIPETDANYKQLEEVTTSLDGKLHAEEEGSRA